MVFDIHALDRDEIESRSPTMEMSEHCGSGDCAGIS